jgi:hypothetical protein
VSIDDRIRGAETMRARVNWRAYPKLAGIFEHRPATNSHWLEFMALIDEEIADRAERVDPR